MSSRGDLEKCGRSRAEGKGLGFRKAPREGMEVQWWNRFQEVNHREKRLNEEQLATLGVEGCEECPACKI